MNLQLDSKIESINGVGPKMALKLNRLGIDKIVDLFYFFPRKYSDYTDITKIADIPEVLRERQDNVLTIKGTLLGIANKRTRRRGFTVTEGVLADDSGSLKVVWFNQPYLGKMFKAGSRLVLNGRVNFDSFSNSYVIESPTRANQPKIQPIYPEISGISSFYISKLFEHAKPLMDQIEEYLPREILVKNKLPGIREAILNIHLPKNSDLLDKARERLAFDELFFISLKSVLAKAKIEKETAPSIKTDINSLREIIGQLPFALTSDQRKAVWQIIKDIEKNVPMNRLLNGDVGSGKTLVAALAAFSVGERGLKTIFMAPTEILANQHCQTFATLFGENEVGIMTASKKSIPSEAKYIIGTHALIQKGISFEDVGLVIVDEQHRFGVKQRAALSNVGCSQKMHPHFLSMTATPIPRTLHLALFGDLDVSVIVEKPANRKEIITRFVGNYHRDKAYDFIKKQIESGRQAFVICPLIEESGELSVKGEIKSLNSKLFTLNLLEEERKSVKAEYEKLQKIFPDYSIAMLHGKMKAKEKDEIMTRFSENKVKILVSTSVVEVGVDIPNASVMIIEDADRFGLAQIHQFRGRVGRGEHQSYCFLFSNSKNERTISRLENLEKVSDGFKLAEIDLETRGPGAIFGLEQSGLLDLKMASISDRILIEKATESAKEVASEVDKYPLLKKKLGQFLINKHLE